MNTHRHRYSILSIILYIYSLIFFLYFSVSSGSDSSSSESVNGESFYLHNPQEVIYNRVKDLFEASSPKQPLSALTGNYHFAEDCDYGILLLLRFK